MTRATMHVPEKDPSRTRSCRSGEGKRRRIGKRSSATTRRTRGCCSRLMTSPTPCGRCVCAGLSTLTSSMLQNVGLARFPYTYAQLLTLCASAAVWSKRAESAISCRQADQLMFGSWGSPAAQLPGRPIGGHVCQPHNVSPCSCRAAWQGSKGRPSGVSWCHAALTACFRWAPTSASRQRHQLVQCHCRVSLYVDDFG